MPLFVSTSGDTVAAFFTGDVGFAESKDCDCAVLAGTAVLVDTFKGAVVGAGGNAADGESRFRLGCGVSRDENSDADQLLRPKSSWFRDSLGGSADARLGGSSSSTSTFPFSAPISIGLALSSVRSVVSAGGSPSADPRRSTSGVSVSSERLVSLVSASAGVTPAFFGRSLSSPRPCEYCSRGLPAGGESYAGGGEGGLAFMTLNVPAVFTLLGGVRASLLFVAIFPFPS